MATRSERISPTAHYTGQIWLRNGLSFDALQTPQGRAFYLALQPLMRFSRALRGPTLEDFLLARHQLIDFQLSAAIDSGAISQVIEIAAGYSPRGLRYAQRYGAGIRYVEADLPDVAAAKQRLIGGLMGAADAHRIVALDALAGSGPQSLPALCDALDPRRGTAIITEGLLNYFARAEVEGMWQRFATALRRFPQGLYLSDLHLANGDGSALANRFAPLLAAFVRGPVNLHYDSSAAAEAALQACQLPGRLLRPQDFADRLPACRSRGARMVRVIMARPSP